MSEKILLVDDDPNALESYKRQLRKTFQVETAAGGQKGLGVIDNKGPFAVVVADMRMPGMDGIQFLAKVKEKAPGSVRIMLTGNADMNTAIDAVNEGNIFRFLTKPCPPETLVRVLTAGIEQYRLVAAERELLENTLRGSVKVLTDMLSLSNPSAFGRASRIRHYVRHIASELNLPNIWQYELAGMLSLIGCVTVPPEILDKLWAQRPVSRRELNMYSAHPALGSKLLASIPRLEVIARMIEGQLRFFQDFPAPTEISEEEHAVAMGSQMLKVALDLDQLLLRGKSMTVATAELRMRRGKYNPKLVATLETLPVRDHKEDVVKEVTVKGVSVHMVADEDIRARSGILLVSKGQEITYPVLVQLRNFAHGKGVQEPFRVRVASDHA